MRPAALLAPLLACACSAAAPPAEPEPAARIDWQRGTGARLAPARP